MTTVTISHATKDMLIIFLLGFSIMWTKKFQMSKLSLEKEEELEIKLSTFSGAQRKLRILEKHLPLFNWLRQSLWLCGSQQAEKVLKEMGIPDHVICLLRSLFVGQETTEACMEQLIGSRLRKEYDRAVCCYLVC